MAHPLMPHLLNIKLVFLTPNTTMDQGVIKCLKSAYRKLLVKKMMTHMEESPEKPFPINILDAIEMISCAWKTETFEAISKYFKHAGFKVTNDVDIPEEDEAMNNKVEEDKDFFNSETWEEYVSIDDNLLTTEQLTDQETAKEVQHGTLGKLFNC